MRAVVVLLALLAAGVAHAAVDTAQKRSSVLNMTGFVLPPPSAGVTEADRAQSAKAYSGFDYGEAVDRGRRNNSAPNRSRRNL